MISQETHKISARFFTDNTDYTSPLNNIWSNRSLNNTLAVKEITVDATGSLLAILDASTLTNDEKSKVQTLQEMYPWKIQVDQDSITIKDHIPTQGIDGRNTQRDGISIMKEWTFTDEWDTKERAFWIGINWEKNPSEEVKVTENVWIWDMDFL